MLRRFAFCVVLGLIVGWSEIALADSGSPPFRVGVFSADVTIPLGHRCMGILPTKAKVIEDRLEAHGFVLLGSEKPLVLLALDWCELRNGAYDEWRDALAEAAGTTRERVLVSSLHQHDAPVCDKEAQTYLDGVGLEKELYDRDFHAKCIQQTTEALKDALKDTHPVTHLGLGEAKVEKVASSRRTVGKDGKVHYNRYSSSGGDAFHSQAPDGLIDPNLKLLSFWNGEEPILAISSYATHPMSYYGRGGVTADFVGMARRRFQRDHPKTLQIYVTGCSGDVTAGKYNDGSPAMRPLLADRIYRGMKAAWENTKKHPLQSVAFRNAKLDLPFHDGADFTRKALQKTLNDPEAKAGDRILAAMSLSSRDRIQKGQKIDLPCVDFGPAQIVVFPGEAFVGYQLLAQEMRPDSFVMSIGYGECWPGYIPTKAAFEDGFNHGWRWVSHGSEQRIREALTKVLKSSK